MAMRGFGAGGIPRDGAEWDRFWRDTIVVPDVGSVGEEQVAAGAITTDKIAPNAATNTIIRDGAGCSVIGRSANTTGDPADILIGEGEFLVRRSNAVTSSTILDADLPTSIARDAEVGAAISSAIALHEAQPDPHPVYPLAAGAETIAGAWTFSLPLKLPSYTVAGVPAAATYAAGLIYVSNETGGAVIAFSDGINWRRVTDRAVIA